jgi:glyoxylase-like metal-dependent hydrolase (beta-lactamase superfamily II)
MRGTIRFAIFILPLLAFEASAQDESDWSEITVRTKHVQGQVHQLWAKGGNVGVFAGKDGILLVDNQHAPLTDKIVAGIRNISDGQIRYVINTHIHSDHVGGNENFSDRGALVVAHENVRSRLAQGLMHRWKRQRQPGAPYGALPVLTYNRNITFHMNGETVDVFVVPPAHTDGDSFIYFEGSDVMHLGDVFRTFSYPVVDNLHGGSFLGIIHALGIAIDRGGPLTRYIPGHGPPTGIEEVHAIRDVLITIRDRAQELIDRGLSKEEVIAARPSQDFDEELASGSWYKSDLMISILYDELTAPR